MVKFEDLTKEELITFIKESCIYPGECLECALVYAQYVHAINKADEAGAAALKDMSDYIKLLEQTQRASSIKEHMNAQKKGTALLKQRSEHEAKEKRNREKAMKLYNKWKRLNEAACLKTGSS